MNIRQELITNFHLTDDNFGYHESDLYVKYSPEVYKWLNENLEHPKNMEFFINQIDKKRWIDIPFMNDSFWEKL